MVDDGKWLTEFGARQDSVGNPGVYWLSLMLLLVGTVGLLWSLPIPAEFSDISPLMNWGTAFLMAAAVYYFIISLSLGLGMIFFIVGVASIQLSLSELPVRAEYASSVMTGIGVGGLCFGRYANGGTRAVLCDIQLVMIAPAWMLSNLYRRLGIPF